jgi:single-strand DNA-binding protein
MKSVNKVILLGNLTRDPELRKTEGKHAVCAFGLATNRNWTTDTGQKREEVEYHRLVAWDKLAAFCSKYLRKGRKVYVEGRLQTRSYTGKDGTEKTVTEVVLDEMLMLDPMPKAVREALEFHQA